MSNPTEQDYKTADAMIDYYSKYKKVGQRESEKGQAKRRSKNHDKK